jgi:LmbE family N-acetylglucosaminyl deacetylase
MTKMNVLVVAAHPDDEVLGVGGAAALHAERGDRVTIAIMCEGVSVRYAQSRKDEVRAQSEAAAKILGAADLHLGDLPEQRLETLPISEVALHIERLIEKVQPTRIYTHFAGDINRDHRVLAEATLIAARPYAAPSVRDILMYETPSSTEWSSPQLPPVFQPTLFTEISSVLEKKLDAFSQYTAELRDYPHPRSLQALRERARYWGSLVNQAAVEPFAVARMVIR